MGNTGCRIKNLFSPFELIQKFKDEYKNILLLKGILQTFNQTL